MGIKQGMRGAGEGSRVCKGPEVGPSVMPWEHCRKARVTGARVGDADVRRAGRGPAGHVWSLDIIVTAGEPLKDQSFPLWDPASRRFFCWRVD